MRHDVGAVLRDIQQANGKRLLFVQNLAVRTVTLQSPTLARKGNRVLFQTRSRVKISEKKR